MWYLLCKKNLTDTNINHHKKVTKHKEKREKYVEVDKNKNTIRVNLTSSRKKRSSFLPLEVGEDLSVFNKRMID